MRVLFERERVREHGIQRQLPREQQTLDLELQRRGVLLERLDRLKAPAGLDLGAVTPAEIAISILAEIVQHHRSAKAAGPDGDDSTPVTAPTEARDPICRMLVEIATAEYRSDVEAGTVYFCCRGCKERFDAPRGARS